MNPAVKLEEPMNMGVGPFCVYQNITRKREKVKLEQDQNIIKAKKAKHRSGRWTQPEDEVYMKYIVANQPFFLTESIRRKSKVFEKLSKLLNYNRTSDQCRSHHTKMRRMTESGSMEEIIEYLQNKHIRKRKQMDSKKNHLITGLQLYEQMGYKMKQESQTEIYQLKITLFLDQIMLW